MPTAAHDWDLWSTQARLVVTDPARLDDALAVTAGILDAVELAASRFRDDSELVGLPHRLALSGGRVPVTPTLTRLLAAALDAAAWTDGAVDPTLGGALADVGYDRDITLIPVDDHRPVVVRRRRSDWRSIRLDGSWLSAPADLELDLGATAKAVAADLVAAAVAEHCATGLLVSLGGDVATAGPAPAGGWQVSVRDGADQPVAHVTLPSGAAIATSSTLHRTWQRAGRTVHHVLDPWTGLPAEPVWRTVSVAAETCARANAATTATIVKGADGPRWLREQGLTARLVGADGEVRLLNGWPPERSAA